MRHLTILLASCAAITACDLSAASAKDAEPAAPATTAPAEASAGDIIVTARKRQESLLKVPVTEAVLGAVQLQQQQITDIGHVVSHVPGLGVGQQVSTIGAQISIRGVGTTTLDAGVDQSVTLNIDGLQLSQGLAFKSGLFDLAQVEVLKGPQSLYYGKNSTAGVIALHTADPGDHFELKASTGYEFEGQESRNELVVSGPVTPTLGLRLATMYDDYRGYYYNNATPNPAFGGVAPTDDRVGGDRSFIIRGTAVWKPVPEFDARLKVNYTSDIGTGPAGVVISCPSGTGAVTTPPVNFLSGTCGVSRNANVSNMNPAAFPGVYNNGQQVYQQRQGFGTLELHYRPAQDVTLTSLTGYYHVGARALINGTVASDAPGLATDNNLHRDDFTQEVRLESDYSSPLNFLVGAFAQDSKVTNLIRVNTNLFVNDILGLPYPPILYNGGSDMRIHAYSGFGQLRWKPVHTVEIAAGARYTDETRTDVVTDYAVNADYTDGAGTNLPLAVPRIHSGTWSPELTVTWTPTNTLTVYGSVKQGYKSGSFSISEIFLTPDPQANFGDEKVQGGELGLKAKMLDRSLFVNLAGYYYFYKGLQVGTSTNACAPGETPPCAPRNLTLNAGAARVYGIDFDSTYQPQALPGLTLRGAINWNIARFVRLDGIQCSGGETVAEGCNELIGGVLPAQNLSGTPLIRAPDWQLNGGAEYETGLPNDMRLSLGADVQYSSSYLTQITDRRDSDETAYAKINANVTLKSPDDRWELALIGNNLTDKLTFQNSTVANLQAGGLYAPYGYNGKDAVLAFMDRGRELWVKVTFKL